MNPTPLAMSQRLEVAQNHIDILCAKLDEFGENKAQTLVDYESALAVAITKHRDSGTPSTIVKDLAKADCRDERFASEFGDIKYRSLIVKINAAEAKLNAKQSQNRYLDSL